MKRALVTALCLAGLSAVVVAWAQQDAPLTAPVTPPTRSAYRVREARIIVQVPVVDPNGNVVGMDGFEILVGDPAYNQTVRDELVLAVRRMARLAGKIP